MDVFVRKILQKLKEYVKMQARPKGFIVEGCVVDKALMFCSIYLQGVETKFNLQSQVRLYWKRIVIYLDPNIQKIAK